MACEVAVGELGESIVPIEKTTSRNPLVDKGIGVLLAPPATAADDGLELAVHQDEGEALPRPVDPRAVQDARDVVPRETPVSFERRGYPGLTPLERATVEPELPITRSDRPLHARPRERQQPADVVTGYEVPRRSQHVGAHDRPHVQRTIDLVVRDFRRALTDRPLRRSVILGLHCAVPTNGLVGGSETRSRQP